MDGNEEGGWIIVFSFWAFCLCLFFFLLSRFFATLWLHLFVFAVKEGRAESESEWESERVREMFVYHASTFVGISIVERLKPWPFSVGHLIYSHPSYSLRSRGKCHRHVLFTRDCQHCAPTTHYKDVCYDCFSFVVDVENQYLVVPLFSAQHPITPIFWTNNHHKPQHPIDVDQEVLFSQSSLFLPRSLFLSF